MFSNNNRCGIRQKGMQHLKTELFQSFKKSKHFSSNRHSKGQFTRQTKTVGFCSPVKCQILIFAENTIESIEQHTLKM